MICEKIFKYPTNRIEIEQYKSIIPSVLALLPCYPNSTESSFMKMTDEWLRQIPAAIAAIMRVNSYGVNIEFNNATPYQATLVFGVYPCSL